MMREAHNCVTVWHGGNPLMWMPVPAATKPVKAVVKQPKAPLKTSVRPRGEDDAMNLDALCRAVALEAGIDLKQAEKTLSTALQCMTRKLGSGGVVKLHNFGQFTPSLRKAPPSRNPQTGERMMLAPFFHVKFRAGKAVKIAINSEIAK